MFFGISKHVKLLDWNEQVNLLCLLVYSHLILKLFRLFCLLLLPMILYLNTIALISSYSSPCRYNPQPLSSKQFGHLLVHIMADGRPRIIIQGEPNCEIALVLMDRVVLTDRTKKEEVGFLTYILISKKYSSSFKNKRHQVSIHIQIYIFRNITFLYV